MGTGLLVGVMSVFCNWTVGWLHNSANLPKTTEMCSLNWLICDIYKEHHIL